MGKLILVTGGARSGKSTYAEEMVKNIGGNVLYIATSIPVDEEMELRVKKHREQRPAGWETLEAYKDLDVQLIHRLSGKTAVLLDCVTIMVTNILMEQCRDINTISNEEGLETEKAIQAEISKVIETAKKEASTFILVTNEVGMGVVPEYPSGRLFRDVAGRANQMLAKAADEVYLCVSGIPVRIK